jgi:chaperone required for assembly of F1-ATPase
MTGAFRRRFYKDVAVDTADGTFAVLLDRRRLRTPAGLALALPTRPLADAVAEEWRQQGETIKPQSMPLFSLAATAIDRVLPLRDAVIGQICAYAGADLLCYRARQPSDLVAAQHAAWQPLLDWAAATFGARLTVTEGVIPVVQPPAAVQALHSVVATLEPLALAALASAVQTSGSLIVGLALVHGRIDAATAHAVACLDEQYQANRWGHDSEADRRRQRTHDDLQAAERFLTLCGTEQAVT